jgi:hypothetical protein
LADVVSRALLARLHAFRQAAALSLAVVAVSVTGCAAGAADTPGSGTPDSSIGGDTGAPDEDAAPTDDASSSDTKKTDAGGDTKPGGDSATSDTATSTDTKPGDTAVDGGDACPTPCSLGVKVCEGDAVKTCISSGGCAVFSAPVACPGGTVCSAGACAATCTDVCVLGSKQCSGSGVQTCEKKSSGCTDWSAAAACAAPTVCSGGACVLTCTDACTGGAKRCAAGSSTATQLCEKQASGCFDWSPAAACAGGGSCTGAGVCLTCAEGSKRCGATGNVETCTTGTWTETAPCSFGCSSGACTTTVACTAGTYRCSGLAVEVCNASGTAYLYTATCAISCSGGLCTGACTPGAKRCNTGKVETCNSTGTTWTVTETCTGSCDGTTSTCVLPSLDVTTNTDKDGEIVVSGAVIVRSGASLNSPTGNLTIRAKSITVERGASITAAPTGDDAALNGSTGSGSSCYGYGGGGGTAAGNATDAIVGKGGKGGLGGYGPSCVSGGGGTPGPGGGVIRLIADSITVAGSVTANGQAGGPASGSYTGGGGGGAGGGILLAADNIAMSGTLSAAGGGGGPKYGTSSYSYVGTPGASGRVKLLYGTTPSVTGSITGARTDGLLPPLGIASSTHPDQSLFYNDDFSQVTFAWERPWASRFGYYHRLSTTFSDVPVPATGSFLDAEVVAYDRAKLIAGNNWLHIVSINAASTVGTVENRFLVKVNTTPPSLASSSHPSPSTFTANSNPFFSWTVPNGDANYKGFHYVFDHYGDTVPTLSDAFLPISQKTKLQPSVADGVWAMHLVTEDTHGYLTKAAGHYVVRIGTSPGTGGLLGTITATTGGAPITGAKVTINRGLLVATTPDQTTNAVGAYNFATVPPGTWEITVSKTGYTSKTVTVTVTKDASATLNVTLDP